MTVTMKDFENLDVRVGVVVSADSIPGMSRIFRVKVDVGDKSLQAIAGGAQYYKPESLIGKRVIVLTNLEPKTIAGVTSECMLLAADHEGKPVWLTVEENVSPGTKVK